MSNINQNRSVEDLEQILKQFFFSTQLEHEIEINFETIIPATNDALSKKINEHLRTRMESFSMPELIKILALCVSKTRPDQQKVESKKKLKIKTPELQ